MAQQLEFVFYGLSGDFVLFRKLATQKVGPLKVVDPEIEPKKAMTIIEPIDGESPRCPFKDCSAVFSH